MAHRTYEIRCPVHGFIQLSAWEREIIDQRAFQRLRRISQLGWTDHVYPGARHTRFEHSLGVMHVATQLYDSIVERFRSFLHDELDYDDTGLARHRVLIRLAALLHDVGHGPFSHAAEGTDLYPARPETRERFKHEDYTAAVVRSKFADVIDNDDYNRANYEITADHVADFIAGAARTRNAVFWRDLVSGQLDADRMDYLLRDSHHAGVAYGKYDLARLIRTIAVAPAAETSAGAATQTTAPVPGGEPRIGIGEDGWHAAEALVLARYFMFTQVYFHKTRAIYDYHVTEALRELIPGGVFAPPTSGAIDDYLSWDDWKVLGAIAGSDGGEHARRLAKRDHYRMVYETPEVPSPDDTERLDRAKQKLGDLVAAELVSDGSWYRFEGADVPVISGGTAPKGLSEYSPVVNGLRSIHQVRLYARAEDADAAKRMVSAG